MALKQRAEGFHREAGALEARLALIKAQRNKLLAAFEGFAGTDLHRCLAVMPSILLVFLVDAHIL